MIAAIGFSAALVLKRIRYEIWYATHLTFYIALALAFGHQLEVGSDFTDNRWVTAYWYLLYAFTFGNLILYRVVRPPWLSFRHRFAVARLEPETEDVTSVYLEGRNLNTFKAEAGQFVIVRFLAPGFRWEEHPFSISRKPDGERLRLTIKQLGDYTRRIPLLKPGTRAVLDGPHGVFTARRCASPKVLMIAAGIGITPVRSLAEDLIASEHDIVLIYANRDRASAVFLKELDDLAAHSGGRLRVACVMSNDPDWAGEKGRIDRDKIERLAPDVNERDVYLCGPPPMMKAVRSVLASLGVPRDRIHWELFSL
jgi:predicted ferric reductase